VVGEIDFIYASDENYNKQLAVSINSLLSKLSINANIHVIHKNVDSFNSYLHLFDKHSNLNQFNFYQFEKNNHIFPNIENSHISEATYYRLFIDKYIDPSIRNYLYLDSDIVCLNDPHQEIKKIFKQLVDNVRPLAARTELYKDQNIKKFQNLGLNGSKYFNAGVILVNHEYWLSKNIYSDLLNSIENIKEKLEFWDQDVLNYYFDGDFIELNNKLNYNLDISNEENNIEEIKEAYFIHYQGSNKPWSIYGAQNIKSKFYNNEYEQLFSNKYHIVSKYSRGDAIKLLKTILSLKIVSYKNPINFIKQSIKAIFKI
tara:strand:+ start:27394 stop:28338 length:945 start_codon:yes stop_codon:yes gene_type:complete